MGTKCYLWGRLRAVDSTPDLWKHPGGWFKIKGPDDKVVLEKYLEEYKRTGKGTHVTKYMILDSTKEPDEVKMSTKEKEEAKADGPTNSGMRWPVAFSKILTDAGIECKDGMIAEADLDKVIDLLEPHIAIAEDKEKIVEDDICIDWLWSRAAVDNSGVYALEKWLEKVDKGEADTLAKMKTVLEDFKNDIEEYCLPAVEKMIDEIELIESGIEDGDIELVDEDEE